MPTSIASIWDAAKRSPVVRVARIAVTIGLVGLLGWKAGVTELTSQPMDWRWAAVAFALTLPSVALRAYNHALLLNRPTKVLSFAQALRLTVVGVGIGLFVPSGAADFAKAYWGVRRHGSAEAMVVSVILDKLTSLSAVAAMGAVGGFWAARPVIGWAAVVLLILTLLPFAAPRIVPWGILLRFLAPGQDVDPRIVARVARPPLVLLLWVYVVSITGWLLTYAVLGACLRAFGADVPMADVLAFGPVSTIARLLPVSIAGIGLGEATLAALFMSVGVPAGVAARSVLLSMIALVLVPGAVGAVLLASGRRRGSLPQ